MVYLDILCLVLILCSALLNRMRLIDRACVSLMVCELHLYDHLEALANYFCFQDGEFGQALCDSLCHLVSTRAITYK